MSEVIPVAAIDAVVAKGRESKLYISRKYAQGLLEAAAPHMLTDAWDEGMMYGSRGQPRSQEDFDTNPYRSQT